MIKPQIIAHRGFWNTGNCAQNSLRSLQNAQNLKVYGSEFDVRLTKDGVPVIHHDPEINGLTIADTDFKTISSQLLFDGETIPTLKDYLKQGKKSPETKLIMELKDLETPDAEEELAEKCVAEIVKSGTEDQIVFISFSLPLCKTIKRLMPDRPVQYLAGNLSPAELKKIGLDGFDYEDVVLKRNPQWVLSAQELGLQSNCWTVDDIGFFQLLKELEIDFVTTNIPDILLKS